MSSLTSKQRSPSKTHVRMWRGASAFALESALGPQPKQQALSTQHVEEQPAPSPSSPTLCKLRTGRGQEGTGIKARSGQAVSRVLLIRGYPSLPWGLLSLPQFDST